MHHTQHRLNGAVLSPVSFDRMSTLRATAVLGGRQQLLFDQCILSWCRAFHCLVVVALQVVGYEERAAAGRCRGIPLPLGSQAPPQVEQPHRGALSLPPPCPTSSWARVGYRGRV